MSLNRSCSLSALRVRTSTPKPSAGSTNGRRPCSPPTAHTEHPADDPFHGCELDPEAVLRTCAFEDVLFTADAKPPGECVDWRDAGPLASTVEEAGEFVANIDTDTPQIVLPASVGTQIETASKPYTAAAFFHFKATGSLERHRAYHAAFESDAFSVEFEADYESSDLTITVERYDHDNI